MSPFEFILIVVSVVAGFAVSEVLSGWGRLIRERIPISKVAVHLVASTWLLFMITRYLWVLWETKGIDWRFVDFVFSFLPVLFLALAAFVTNPARALAFDPASHYMSQARPFCYLAALFFLTWNLGSLSSTLFEDALAQLTGLIVPLFFAGLAHVRNQMIHGVSFAGALLLFMLMSVFFFTNLGET